MAPHLPDPEAVLLDESLGGKDYGQVDIQTFGATGAPTAVAATSNKRSRKDNGFPVLDVEGITIMEQVNAKEDAVCINPARKRIKKHPIYTFLKYLRPQTRFGQRVATQIMNLKKLLLSTKSIGHLPSSNIVSLFTFGSLKFWPRKTTQCYRKLN